LKSVAFFNNKGGVGKTTLLCNVAAYLAIYKEKKVCVIDADPQCNATQYFLPDEDIESLYGDTDRFTISKIVEPLSLGEGYSDSVIPVNAERFSLDLIPGDPRMALTEDLLSKDWGDAKSGAIRGIKTSLVFSALLTHLMHYDLVFFDVSPSLGALNRAVMLSSDYFVSPVSLDIFSLKAFENIAEWIEDWWGDWEIGLANVKNKSQVPELRFSKPDFVGYVTQQYLAKRDSAGQSRAVQAYENIRKNIDKIIIDNKLASTGSYPSLEIGTVPNLFSLVPMSQTNHAPIFELTASDGVIGAHFSKVKETKNIFGAVAEELLSRIGG
jgi:cellulose biosynthesis protein BcsQ